MSIFTFASWNSYYKQKTNWIWVDVYRFFFNYGVCLFATLSANEKKIWKLEPEIGAWRIRNAALVICWHIIAGKLSIGVEDCDKKVKTAPNSSIKSKIEISNIQILPFSSTPSSALKRPRLRTVSEICFQKLTVWLFNQSLHQK